MEIIVGAFVSVVVQIMKKYFDTDSWQTWGIAICMSIVGATLYTFFKMTDLWPTIVSVLTTSGAFYAYILTRLEK